jgi:hypothetical protein
MDEEENFPLDDEEEDKEPEPEAEEEPEEEPEDEEEPEPKPKKQGGCGLWKILTLILLILLITCYFTHGFKFGGVTGGVVAEEKTSTAGVSVTVLSDSRCKECDTTSLITQLETVFGELDVTELDYSDDEGKALYDETGVVYLPAVLFTDDVKTADAYDQLQMYLIPAGDYLSLRIGADFDPEAEICDNGIDDTGNGKIDCKDPGCEGSLVCREEKSKDLQVFVMSQCPYGTKALDAMKEVLEAFKDDSIKFNVHYIASENEDGSFNSLHGQAEVDEDLRQVCAKKYYEADNKYMDYIWCRNPDITSSDWEGCAKDNGMSATKIKACAEGDEGPELLAEDIRIAQELGISASPTWLANNKYTFSGIDAEKVKTEFCNYNEDLAGCGAELSSDTAVSGSC